MTELTFASYNVHKAIGADRRRDPERILAVIDELGADVVGLQEVDMRLGQRASVFERARLEHLGWQLASVPMKPASLGWHGNMLLVRDGLTIDAVDAVHLPRLEPRGALTASLRVDGQPFNVTSMHLDLSGLRRKAQLAQLCAAGRASGQPALMLGDLNAWLARPDRLRGLHDYWSVLTPGRSFPARGPLLSLDRMIVSPHWRCTDLEVFRSVLAREASDHLPIRARLVLDAQNLGNAPTE